MSLENLELTVGPSVIPIEAREKITDLVKKYPQQRSALIPSLWIIQEAMGWIPPVAMMELAEMLNVQPVEVQETASFYSLLFKKPVGKYVIDVCVGLSCMLLGGNDLSESVQKKLGIKPGETTADGLFTLREVECIACCMGAPAAQINYEYKENLTSESLSELIDQLSKEAVIAGKATA